MPSPYYLPSFNTNPASFGRGINSRVAGLDPRFTNKGNIDYGGQNSGSFTEGQAAGAIGGAIGLGAQAYGMSRQGLNLPQYDMTQQYSPTGQPSYNGEIENTATNARVQRGATGGEIGGAVATGALTGASVGGPWGAVVGGAVGAGTAIVGGAARGNRQQRDKNRAEASASGYQSAYNSASKNFEQNQNAQIDYQRRTNNYKRFQNLYSLPSQYYYG